MKSATSIDCAVCTVTSFSLAHAAGQIHSEASSSRAAQAAWRSRRLRQTAACGLLGRTKSGHRTAPRDDDGATARGADAVGHWPLTPRRDAAPCRAMQEIETEVAVVGGGPVGVALAIDLGQRGVRCVVVERHRAPQRIPKGQNLTQRTMEHFRAWRCEAELRAARTLPKGFATGGMTTYRTLLSDYHHDWFNRGSV